MINIFVNNYDSESICAHYMDMASDTLISEYEALNACLVILTGGGSDLANSYVSEYADSVVCIMREVMADRYIEMIKAESSVCKVVRLVASFK